jgi:NTE family protein
MRERGPSFFAGLSAEQVDSVLDGLETLHFPAGSVVVAEGDAPRAVYILRTGTADVLITDRHGREHLLNRVGPGETVGEMSVLTGEPASATVRAAAELSVSVLRENDFHRVAGQLPQIYRNLGTLLAERLTSTNRQTVRRDGGRVSVLVDDGAPPLLGYALACSVAWHTRAPTLLLAVHPPEMPPPDDLLRLSSTMPARSSPTGDGRPAARAHVQLQAATGPFSSEMLTRTSQQLAETYDHVLVLLWGDPPSDLSGRRRRLARADEATADAAPDLAETIRAWVREQRPDREARGGALAVPTLTAEDERALATGLLPATSDAGRVLGRASRELAGLRVGLALGAGSVKGYAHIGVLSVLARAGVPVDYIAGTSIGSAVAALWATDHSPEAAADVLDRVGGAAFRLTVPVHSLLSSAGLREGVRELAGRRRIEELRVPCAIVAADLITGQEVVFRRGPLWAAILASMAIPGIYPPQRIGPYALVDGGILNPVPSNVVAEMGADTVIAVKLAGRPATTPAGNRPDAPPRVPSVIQAILRSIETMQGKIVTDTAAAATLVIEPEFTDAGRGWGLRHFSEGRRYTAVGEAAAEAALPRIAAALPWLQP